MSARVWFYNPQQDRTTSYNFINKIVAGLTPPFCHVELQFPDGDACSIVMHDTVRMRKRTFDEQYYTCVSIPSTALALQSCKALALWHCERHTSFGCTADSTFCSKLVAELLRDGGVVPADVLADGVCISPSTLYRVLTGSTHVLLPQRQPCVSAPIVPLHFSQLNGPQELRVHSRGVTR